MDDTVHAFQFDSIAIPIDHILGDVHPKQFLYCLFTRFWTHIDMLGISEIQVFEKLAFDSFLFTF
jgi:hypothetical protein